MGDPKGGVWPRSPPSWAGKADDDGRGLEQAGNEGRADREADRTSERERKQV